MGGFLGKGVVLLTFAVIISQDSNAQHTATKTGGEVAGANKNSASFSDPVPAEITPGLIESRINLHFKDGLESCDPSGLANGQQPKPLLNQLNLAIQKSRDIVTREAIQMNSLTSAPPDWEVEELNQVLSTDLHFPATSPKRTLIQDYVRGAAGPSNKEGFFSPMWHSGESVYGNYIITERLPEDYTLDARHGYPKVAGTILRSGAGVDTKNKVLGRYKLYIDGANVDYVETTGPYLTTSELLAKHGRVSQYVSDKKKSIETVAENQKWLISQCTEILSGAAISLFFPPVIGGAVVAGTALRSLAAGCQGKIRALAVQKGKEALQGDLGSQVDANYRKIETSYDICDGKSCGTNLKLQKGVAGQADYQSMFDPAYLQSLSNGHDSMKEVDTALKGEFKSLLPDMRDFAVKFLSMRDVMSDTTETDITKRSTSAYLLATEMKNKIDTVDQALGFALRDLHKECSASIAKIWSGLNVPEGYGDYSRLKDVNPPAQRDYAKADKIYRGLRNSNIDLVMAEIAKKKAECIASEMAIRQQRMTWFTNIAYLTSLSCKQTNNVFKLGSVK